MTPRTHRESARSTKSSVISVLILTTALPLLACNKKEQAPETEPNPSPSATSAPTAENSSAPAALDTSTANALAAELTQIVRKYAAEKQRAPKTFEELVAAGYLPSVPAAPGGKKFAIDKNLQVTLVDQ